MLLLERLPRLPEVHLGVVEGGGAVELPAGDVELHMPQPNAGGALGRVAAAEGGVSQKC